MNSRNVWDHNKLEQALDALHDQEREKINPWED
jgi:RNA polymerase-interacting CarD/CdnL/TRCF family regulator